MHESEKLLGIAIFNFMDFSFKYLTRFSWWISEKDPLADLAEDNYEIYSQSSS